MATKDKKVRKDPSTTKTPATENKSPAAKGKLKIRELTEEEVDEVSGGMGGQAAFCQT